LFPTPGVAYLQDGTGGIAVVGTRDRQVRGDLKLGSLVEASGVLAPGEQAPVINGAHRLHGKLRNVGNAPLPEVRKVTIADLEKPENQGVRVEFPGVIRAVNRERGINAITLTIAAGRSRVVAVIFQPRPNRVPTQLIGAKVRVTGVYNTSYADRQQVFAGRVLVPSVRNIAVEERSADPWDLPETSLAHSAGDDETLGNAPLGARVRGIGTVTLPVPGRGMFLQSAQGAAAVESSQEEPVAAGKTLEAVGFVSRREGSPIIEDAIWREAAPVPPIQPRTITADQAISGEFDAHLVSMEGLLLENSRLDQGPTLVLQAGTKVFLARFVDPGTARTLNENSWLRVTGICLNGVVPQLRGAGDSGVRRTFHLLLSGPEAVEVARAPSWWTFRRVLLVIAALLALVAAAFVWAMVLRRRVAKQTGEIREHLARETLYEERVRIARELHDSLEQDLVGIGMQLKATERLLKEPERARSALQLASAMVRRSQSETHRAVWDLREPIALDGGLLAALHSTLSALAPEDGPEVQIHVHGDERSLPQQSESHLLRIAAEAVTNARKHADATHVQVDVFFEDAAVRLTVTDDGRGFDATSLPLPHDGHFGLFGMRERVQKLGAQLQIQSHFGEGTRIEVVAPLQTPALAIT
ncbi:MAG: histidine kinase, partial [Chthoniobacteraceae bacterium]